MSIRFSLGFSSLLSAAFTVFLVGCAGDEAPDPSASGDDAVAAADESEVRSESFVGRWSGPTVAAGDFRSLDLKVGGRYEATIELCPPPPAGGVGCLALPRPEAGSFRILGSAAGRTLRLAPDGGSARRYKIAVAPSIEGVRALELTRSGRTQVLNQEQEGESCGTVRCAASEVCCNPLLSICTAPGDVCAQ